MHTLSKDLIPVKTENLEMEKWDAETYHKISHIQETWAKELLSKNEWKGNEFVLDAGCGSGRVTNIIAKTLNKGKIFAVDIDENMIKIARKKYKHLRNVIFLNSDLINVNLPEPVDVVFSNAVIHWIPNHYKLFNKFWDILKPEGKILIQCGGKGNLGKTHDILESIRKEKEFLQYFRDWKNPWYFPSTSETNSILQTIGFREIRTEMTKKTAIFQGFEDYRLFMKTVVMKPYLSYLPSNDNNLTRNIFIESFMKQIKRTSKDFLKKEEEEGSNGGTEQPSIDYVRLDIHAIK